MSNRTITLKEFPIDEVKPSSSWIIIGLPGSGKGTFVSNLFYFNKHRFPVARVFTNSETEYKNMKDITHPLYVSNYYSEEEHKNYLMRQRKMTLDVLEGRSKDNPYSILFVDDVGDSKKFFNSSLVKASVKTGNRHWNQLFLMTNQYAIDFPPDVREAIGYVAIFRATGDVYRKKLYNNFGGIFGSYSDFCDVMDQTTGDFGCLIIDNLSQSTSLEDRVYWYRTIPIEKQWKFGCKEYHDWANKRYNKQYTEQVIM